MTYFQPSTCELLEKLGLTSENPEWYDKQGRVVSHSMGSSMLNDEGFGTSDMVQYSPRYTPADIILSAENAKKLWGDKEDESKLILWMSFTSILLKKIWDGEDIQLLIAETAQKRIKEMENS